METPAQASRATVARHTRGTHRVVNDVEVGGARRLHRPHRSIFVLSWDRGIAGVSASSALRDDSPSSVSPTCPYTLSTARQLISVTAASFRECDLAEAHFPRMKALGSSVNSASSRSYAGGYGPVGPGPIGPGLGGFPRTT